MKMDDQTARKIHEDRLTTVINAELSQMVREGLLQMGVTPDGEAIFWPTPHGAVVLGMEEWDETSESAHSA